MDEARYPRNVTTSPLAVFGIRPEKTWRTTPVDREFAAARLEDASANATPAGPSTRTGANGVARVSSGANANHAPTT